MKLVDANVLVYAVDVSTPHHARSKTWLDRALSGHETIALPWISLLAFTRLTTHPRLSPNPLTPDDALSIVEIWMSAPNAVTPEPDGRHPQRIRDVLRSVPGGGGNLINDAHLAALAIQTGASIVTYDTDFDRFDGVSWELPAAPAS